MRQALQHHQKAWWSADQLFSSVPSQGGIRVDRERQLGQQLRHNRTSKHQGKYHGLSSRQGRHRRMRCSPTWKTWSRTHKMSRPSHNHRRGQFQLPGRLVGEYSFYSRFIRLEFGYSLGLKILTGVFRGSRI